VPRYFLRTRKWLLDHVLHGEDSPHSIALGVFIATVFAFLPIPGGQTVFAVAVAALLGANKLVCIPVVWITNPFTALPLYGLCFVVGQFVITTTEPGQALAQFRELQRLSIFDSGFWQQLLPLLIGLGVELWVGGAIVGVVLGIGGYFLTRWGVAAYRERRRQRSLRRSLFRSQVRTAEAASQTEF